MEEECKRWADEQWGGCKLGNVLRTARAVEIGWRMMMQPGASLPKQMEGPSELKGAYRFMNNRRIKMKGLLEPHIANTLEAAGKVKVGLMIHDRSGLDFSGHPKTERIGSIGSRNQRGMLLSSVLVVEPEERQILGIGYAEVIVREEGRKPHNGGQRSEGPEGMVWENGVKAIGSPTNPGTQWMHVSDRESDIFEYMTGCIQNGTGFVLRARWNRAINSEHDVRLLDYVRDLPANDTFAEYTVEVDATKNHAKRTAKIVVSWCKADIQPPKYLKNQSAVSVYGVRAWEPNPPPGAERVEWVLLTSMLVESAADAKRSIKYYECRWLIEDFHMCLKTGCGFEHSQLDDGLDLQNLLGFAAPMAVRLLQIRQIARIAPETPAAAVIDSLMLRLLTLRFKLAVAITIKDFWLAVARLGGYVGRAIKNPPGWRTIWKGWRQLSDWTDGARLAGASR